VGWNEVATGVFQRRYDPLDVSVCVIRGPDGIGVVDTRSSPRQAAELIADLRELGDRPVRWVVNTHGHFDHCFGNQCFGPGARADADNTTAPNAPIYGQVAMPAHLDQFERPMLAGWIADGGPEAAQWREVIVTPPGRLVADHAAIDLGGRTVELLHLGRGHTDHDLIVHVPDAAAWLVGDLVEESGPPAYGPDCFPAEWPGTLARLLALAAEGDVLVPGHGRAVDPPFARAQQAQLAGVAGLIAELRAAGVPVSRAAEAGGARWPLPVSTLTFAIEAGYAADHRPGPS
jgi:glyoxylase-like metal-dependent hydrolase (beta-lactamase superfamily II)